MKQSYSTDLIFLGLIILIAIGLKWYYAQSSTEDLAIILNPVRHIVGLFTGSPSYFNPDLGYHFPTLNITIDRSCSGLNFFVMAFCMIGISTLPFYQKWNHKLLALALGTLATYLLTIGATTSRILIAINSLQLKEIYPWLASDKIHQAQGGFVYLFFLILFYLTATFFHNKIAKHYA